MSNARGDEAKLLVRTQAAFGAAEAAGAGKFLHLPFYNYNVNPSAEVNEDEAIYGDAFPGDSVDGLRALGGSMVVPIGLNSIGWHLQALLGAPVTTEVQSGEYQHVFSATGQPTIPLLTHGITHSRRDIHFVQDSLAYAGMDINARKNSERVRATFNLIGREEETANATLDSTPIVYATDPKPVGYVGTAEIDGVGVAGLTGVNMSLTKGIEADQETMSGQATASSIDQGMWGLTGSLDARFRDRDLYDKANSGEAFALKQVWSLGAKYSLEILKPNVRLERTGLPIDGRGIISSSYSFRANRPAIGQNLVTVTLRNEVADYNNPA
ncbi:hypothetical protein J7426_14320 [Tropicibacter sp. R16_0]|uniref:phage tail tube protein n=1 Tax=Tropicibacter sp. R16_0 TaxID=2821102 RepID=UPI001ADCEA37|nr:phage tail tube protein [Tropicibacter sp. R16_0]MBO9451445.1 hypothetical protein [Tropicibacter sp. R16_0]